MEIWDVYDEKGNKIPDMSVVRGDPVPDGYYHLVCDILVRHTDGTYLITQRDEKKRYGLMWEASAGGSAFQGETPDESAFRELFEETGISADSLFFLGSEHNDKTRALYYVYLCITDMDKESVILQEGETVNFRWISESELLLMPKTELLNTRAISHLIQKKA